MGEVVFDPALGWPIWGALCGLFLGVTALALWRGMAGWPWRALAGMILLAALLRPALEEDRRLSLPDIAVIVVDETTSQTLSDRPAQTQAALDTLEGELRAAGLETRIARVGDAPEDGGSLILAAVSRALSDLPRERVAGIFLISDGQAHDGEAALDWPAPMHLLRTGRAQDWDRAVIFEDAPAFAILGQELRIGLSVQDFGLRPADIDGAEVEITYTIDDGQPARARVPVGAPLELSLVVDHAGANVVQFSIAADGRELTPRNNAVVLRINGVRDRLSVLLVSGEPHMGQRTWRNLLKSDAAVDLVHFTILRPPEKNDGVPVDELALIAFPTRELFMERIDDFDLIIFDRYTRRGILPTAYLENVARYVRDGGAVLMASGPEFASAASLYFSPLADILPASPSARVIEAPFLPVLTDLGQRHPVTAGLDAAPWGRWFRQVEILPNRGQVVMAGHEGAPLLVLDRVGAGRVALLASDQAWLWDRGFEGGGPQGELLRRLAHWMMDEPELEEEALLAEITPDGLRLTRRTMQDAVGPLTLTRPDGGVDAITLTPDGAGRFVADYPTDQDGIFRLDQDALSRVIGRGPVAAREFARVLADDAPLAGAIAASGGGIFALADGMPDLRATPEGRQAHGRGFMGYVPRDVAISVEITRRPVLPAWVWVMAVIAALLAGWLAEGRRVRTV